MRPSLALNVVAGPFDSSERAICFQIVADLAAKDSVVRGQLATSTPWDEMVSSDKRCRDWRIAVFANNAGLQHQDSMTTFTY